MTPEPAAGLREPRERVSPRAVWMWRTEAIVEAVVVSVVAVLASTWWGWFDLRWWLVVAWLAAVGAYVVGVPAWRYRVHRWEVTDTAVHTRTGWWVVEERIAPMSRIQTVDHAQGAVARLFGLASVTITTASSAGALEVVGLERERAAALAERLTVAADAVAGDAT